MNKKKVLSLMLALTMVTGLFAGCGAQNNNADVKSETKQQESSEEKTEEVSKEEVAEEPESSIPEWLHPGEIELVDEGQEKTLTVYLSMSSLSNAEPEDYWQYEFFKEHMNVNLEIVPIRDNRDEMVSLAFASDELPDIFLNCWFSAAELVKYGEIEGQILDMAPYVTEENMPNLYWILNQEEFAGYRNVIETSKGNIWSTGFARDMNEVGATTGSYYYNYDLLKELDIEVPQTLDEFYEAMVTIKEAYPDMYPIGGSNVKSPDKFILNAFGYLAGGSSFLSPMQRDGKFVVPAADRERFGEYIKFMNKLYEAELIHPDYYTMDNSTTSAILKQGSNAFFPDTVYHHIPEEVFSWWSAVPLTSEYQPEKTWAARHGHLTTGNAVITTACEEPELAAAFIDTFYSYYMYDLIFSGPTTNLHSDYLCSLEGVTNVYDEETNAVVSTTYHDVENGTFPDSNTYYANGIRMINAASIGSNIYNNDPRIKPSTKWASLIVKDPVKDFEELRDYYISINNGWNWLMLGQNLQMQRYQTWDIYPEYIYMSPEDTEQLAELKTALSTFVTNEVAKFVTGTRPLDEIDAYFDELEGYGIEDYCALYKKALGVE